MSEVVTIGNATLYCADCMDVLPTLERVDAVITDPPYGIGYVPYLKNAIKRELIYGDDAEFDPRGLLCVAADIKILWGANNYTGHLPRGGWLVWDKRTNEAADKILGSPFELAWHSNHRKYKIARIQHGGAKNADGEGIKREHPTQKPIALMVWCIEQAGNPQTVLDPFMGSGTTGVACAQLGRTFIGIERERKYFDIACERIERAQAQGQMFPPEQVKQVQESLV
jgi:site-specific DNA-methyltransferase (adenine-specific)